ncbi:MAG: hypothetical protein OQJ81_03735 [Melioribacteraceae bacterium]|nr:hypothetical protein [Melioribacteraceae bacterium]
MFNEERIRKNFIDGLSSISTKMKFQTEKELKEYLWKQKDFYRLDLISEEENNNNSFLKDFILFNQ